MVSWKILILSFVFLMGTVVASGRYNEHLIKLPQKLDIKLYKKGKALLSQSSAISKRKEVAEIKLAQVALAEISIHMEKRNMKPLPLMSLQGKLSEDEFLSILFYIKIRYRMHKI